MSRFDLKKTAGNVTVTRVIVTALTAGLCAQAALAKPDLWPCESALSLGAGNVWTGSLGDSRGGEVLAVEVGEPGWLAVQADISGVGATWLELIDSPCASGSSRSIDAGFLNGGLVEVREAATVYLRVGTVDRGGFEGLSDLTLSTHLFPANKSPWHKDGEPGSDTEEAEDEIVPLLFPGDGCFQVAYPLPHTARHKDGEPGSDTEEAEDEIVPLMIPGGNGSMSTYRSSIGSLHEKDGEPGSDTEEAEDEIVPLVHTGDGDVSGLSAVRFLAEKDGEPGSDTEEAEDEIVPFQFPGSGCSPIGLERALLDRRQKDGEPGSDTEEAEDEIVPLMHGGGLECSLGEPVNDFRFCAAHLGLDGRSRGSLNSKGALDRDYYAFTLDHVEHVRIAGDGGDFLSGALYDVNGRVLARAGGESERFSFEVVLSAGHYYLRVEGQGTGDYQVAVTRGELSAGL